MARIILFCLIAGILIGVVAVLDVIAIKKARKITFKEDNHELY